MIQKVLVLLLVLFNVITFTAGLPPYDEHIFNKSWYPANNGLKYTIASLILVIILLFLGSTILTTFQTDDIRVLLSKD